MVETVWKNALFFSVSVRAEAPTISGTSLVTDGGSTTLVCTSTTQNLISATYVWKENNVVLPSVTGSSYTTPALSLANNGNQYKCAVTVNGVTSDDSTTTVTLSGKLILFVHVSVLPFCSMATVVHMALFVRLFLFNRRLLLRSNLTTWSRFRLVHFGKCCLACIWCSWIVT